MIKFIAFSTFILIWTLFSQAVAPSHLAIRKDYECEIVEKDFYIKDCYRNVELNLEDMKMIAGTHQ